MRPSDVLRAHNRRLRAQLRLLEGAMRMAPATPYVLRELCFSLARMFDDHIEHEERLLQCFGSRVTPLAQYRQYRVSLEHLDHRGLLRGVKALLLEGSGAPMHEVISRLGLLIEELREHLKEEECELFPLVEFVDEGKPAAFSGASVN